jgi:hypothetical protein
LFILRWAVFFLLAFISSEELRASVAKEENVDLKNPGKIYFKDNYIFIIEELKGIHIFDNTDPANPVKKTFIKVPGAMDMVISGNFLYADSFVDLVILDVHDVNNVTEVGRVKELLPYTLPKTGNTLPNASIDKTKGVVVGWEQKTIKEKVYDNPVIYPVFRTDMGFEFSNAISYSASGVISSGLGIGGSMARFGIKDNILYILDNNKLKLLDIQLKTNPAMLADFYAGPGIETMFLTDKYMFLGTTTGMITYDINDPVSPVKKSTFTHARSCDPVFVDDTLAYVTLRSGTLCGGNVNRLDIVNIKNIISPTLVSTYSMVNPHGLGKDGDLLFICDGTAGLKIYNASNPKTIGSSLVYSYPGYKTYDVIPVNGILMMIGDDGLFQYDYSNIQNISLLSTIPVVKE